VGRDGVSSTAWQALGRHGLGEDDNTAGMGTTQVDGIAGSGMARGAQLRGLGEEDVVASSGTASRA
jgi:hypothetical protein